MSSNRYGVLLRVTLVVAAFHVAAGQSTQRASIERSGSQLIIKSNDPRPLEQALRGITERFGWRVDYEDPIYSPSESKDIAAPQWRKTHPSEVGFLAPSGGLFVANLPVDTTSASAEIDLTSLVNQYNKTSNPGTFRVFGTSRGRWTVVGHSKAVTSNDPLDTLVNPEIRSETASTVLQKLIHSCSSASGIQMAVGTIPQNVLAQSTVQGHEKVSSCRNQLTNILDSLTQPYVYHVLYDIGSATYVWNIIPAAPSTRTD